MQMEVWENAESKRKHFEWQGLYGSDTKECSSIKHNFLDDDDGI